MWSYANLSVEKCAAKAKHCPIVQFRAWDATRVLPANLAGGAMGAAIELPVPRRQQPQRRRHQLQHAESRRGDEATAGTRNPVVACRLIEGQKRAQGFMFKMRSNCAKSFAQRT